MNRIILRTATQIYSETRFQGICLLSADDAVDVIVVSLRRNTFKLNVAVLIINLEVNIFDY